MPLIYNNKEYLLVPDDSDYDKLEFVAVRKLHVQYISTQAISIEFLRKEFEIYGALEKIEIYCEIYKNIKYAHVTFEENRIAYCALLHCKHNESAKIALIRPADAHLQPDNPVDSSMSPFYNLPDDCLLSIFDHCDFHALAALSSVCKKLSGLLRTRIFAKIPKFNSAGATNESDVKSGLLTVSRLVQCVDPPNFHLKIFRNFESTIMWPATSTDMKASTSELSIELDFFKSEWLCELEKVASRFTSIHVHRSIYDGSLISKTIIGGFFPNATELIVSGYATSCNIPELTNIVRLLPKLERLTFRSGTLKWSYFIHCFTWAEYLQRITFEDCFFDSDIDKSRINEIVNEVEHRATHIPIWLMFDRIQINAPQSLTSVMDEKICECSRCTNCCQSRSTMTKLFTCKCNLSRCSSCGRSLSKTVATGHFNTREETTYEGIKEALNDPEIQKYVHIRIGGDPFSKN